MTTTCCPSDYNSALLLLTPRHRPEMYTHLLDESVIYISACFHGQCVSTCINVEFRSNILKYKAADSSFLLLFFFCDGTYLYIWLFIYLFGWFCHTLSYEHNSPCLHAGYVTIAQKRSSWSTRDAFIDLWGTFVLFVTSHQHGLHDPVGGPWFEESLDSLLRKTVEIPKTVYIYIYLYICIRLAQLFI